MVRAAVPSSRRDVFKRHMRQHRVNEVQLVQADRRSTTTNCANRPPRPSRIPLACRCIIAAEFRPIVGHGRQCLCERLRQDDVQPHEAEVGQERIDRVRGIAALS